MPDQPALTELATLLGGDLDGALDRLRVPAHLVDRDGLVRWQNAKSLALLGDIRSRSFAEMFAPEAQHDARIQFTKKVLGTTRTSDFKSVLRRASGALIGVKIHSVSLVGRDRVVGVFGIVDVSGGPVRVAAAGDLTSRQLQMLDALARGRSTAQIAQESSLSRETVRNHIGALMRALGVHSRVAAVAEARRRDLIH